MAYVRERVQPSSKEAVRLRVARNREALAPSPDYPGARFSGAYDWFRSAAAYAGRRSYRSLDIANAALARREQIVADAALAVRERARAIDALIPTTFRERERRAGFKASFGNAPGAMGQLAAAHNWLLSSARQAARHDRREASRGTPAITGRVNEIKDEAAARLIEWAEEMDRDDYGE